MSAYNAATVIRLTSRPILSAFFEHEGCLQQIDFNKAGLHEIQEAYGALPEQIRSRIEPILRNVFIFSHGKLSMISLVDEIKKYHNTDDRDIIFAFCNQKNRYDQAFFIYMNYPDIWEKACYFVSVDMLPKRFWTRINGLPRRDPKTDAAALQDFGRLVSEYYMKTQIRGKQYYAEYSCRTENDHYFFLFLSDYNNSYEVWEEGKNKMVSRNESRPFSMVLAYNSTYGTIDIHAYGGKNIADALNERFCKAILNEEVTSHRTFRSAFQISKLVYRENKLKPIPEIGIMGATLTAVEFSTWDGNKRHSQRLKIDKNDQDNDDMFNAIESCFPNGIDNATHIPSLQIVLDLMINGIMRELPIELTPNTCTLRSNSEENRICGEEFLRRSHIDEQPGLF